MVAVGVGAGVGLGSEILGFGFGVGLGGGFGLGFGVGEGVDLMVSALVTGLSAGFGFGVAIASGVDFGSVSFSMPSIGLPQSCSSNASRSGLPKSRLIHLSGVKLPQPESKVTSMAAVRSCMSFVPLLFMLHTIIIAI